MIKTINEGTFYYIKSISNDVAKTKILFIIESEAKNQYSNSLSKP